jgi:DNA-directed RNA polymerase specialized sigma24 family protein
MPHAATAEAQVLADDDEQRLWQRVQELSPRCQRLLRIIAFDDRPDYAGIAEELGMPIGSIGPTRGRALERLRKEIHIPLPAA